MSCLQMLVPPEQLHLTLQMLKLYSAEARQTACTVRLLGHEMKAGKD